ncbi:MAG: hypothetical protein AABX01_06765 [Candidatus Micrarchaeota archaeon]
MVRKRKISLSVLGNPWKHPTFKFIISKANEWNKIRTATQENPKGVGTNKSDRQLLMVSYYFMNRIHRGQRRKYTEEGKQNPNSDILDRPYTDHTIDVASSLAEHGVPVIGIAAGFMHDVVEEGGDYVEEEDGTLVPLMEKIRMEFGTDMADILAMVSHPKLIMKDGKREWVFADDSKFHEIEDQYKDESKNNPYLNAIRHKVLQNRILTNLNVKNKNIQRKAAIAFQIKHWDVYDDVEDMLNKRKNIPLEVKIRRLGKFGSFLDAMKVARETKYFKRSPNELNFDELPNVVKAFGDHVHEGFFFALPHKKWKAVRLGINTVPREYWHLAPQMFNLPRYLQVANKILGKKIEVENKHRFE